MKNICISVPNKPSYSETFIKNQIDSISHKNLLHGGRWPFLDQDDKSIFSFFLSINIIRGAVKQLLPKVYHRLYTKALIRFLKKNKMEIMLAQYGPIGVSVFEACKRANVELVVHFHGYDASDKTTLKKYGTSYCKMAEYAKFIVVVSVDMQNQLSKLGMNCKFEYIPYGIDPARFSGAKPSSVPPVCIFVGRFTAKKAPDITIKAFALVLKQKPRAKLVMVGGGDLFESTVQLAKELNISEHVDFVGIKTPDEIANLLKSARLFVQHSVVSETGDSEGTPNTILEASAAGLPIVSTLHAGIKEAVIHEKTGFLVMEKDEIEMSKYMLLLLNDKLLAESMGIEAREHIRINYNLETQINKLNSILCQI